MSTAQAWKAVCFWEAVEIRVPAQWQCIREPDGIWGCYELENDTGTIWVDFDVYQSGNMSASSLRQWQSVEKIFSNDSSSGNSRVVQVDANYRIANIVKQDFDPETGEMLHFSHWHHIARIDATSLAIVHLTFVISPNMLTDGQGLLLAQEIERGLTEAKINWERLAKSGGA